MNQNIQSNNQYLISGDITVRQAEQILWLPLRWKMGSAKDSLKKLSAWEINPQSDEVNEANYAQFLFFHPSVRQFIWGAADEHARLIQYKHKKFPGSHLKVLLPQGHEDPDCKSPHLLCMKLEEVSLFTTTLDADVLIVTIRWSLVGTCKLAEWLDFLDMARRTHMAYFPGEHSQKLKIIGGRVPISAQWTNDESESSTTSFDREEAQQRKNEALKTVAMKQTPMFKHWRELLGEDLVEKTEQIEDERMPYMAAVAVDNPFAITRAEWMRLTQADYRGDAFEYPYSEAFLSDFDRHHFYDRYYESGTWKSTRYLQAGYAFTVVGAHGGEKEKFFREVIAKEHFRGQYAWMGLLLQYNKAALLNFSRQMAQTANKPEGQYSAAILAIQERFITFTHQQWFDGFTNQFQGQEIGSAWANHLGLPTLYETVKNELNMAVGLVNSRHEKNQATQIDLLTRWGLGVAIGSLVVALAGAALPIDKPFALWLESNSEAMCWFGTPGCAIQWERFKVVLVVYVPIVAVAILLWRRLTGRFSQKSGEKHAAKH